MPFHVIGLKCAHCGSYNTCNESEPTDAEAAAAQCTDASNPDDAAGGDSDRNI